MPLEGKERSKVVDDVIAIREKWHNKKHPFFKTLAEGKLPLRAVGVYMAQHYNFVKIAARSQWLVMFRAPGDVGKFVFENMAEEAGMIAGPGEDRHAHDHNELITRFCKVAGMSEAEVYGMKRTPAWWARSLHYFYTNLDEPMGVAMAMASTQEGQQPALNSEVIIPALCKHYGFKPGAKEIEFFTEHAIADVDHSERQLALTARHVNTPELHKRALEVAEEACMLRWASITELYRSEYLKEKEILPE